MTRIDFYLLEQTDADRERFACRLIDKAFRNGHQVYVLDRDRESSLRLEELLWSFQAASFVPHALFEGAEGAAPQAPVLIGWGEPPTHCHDILLPLKDETPSFFARFDRVLEIVGASPEEKERSRERFRFYRDRGYPLEIHRL